MGQKPATHVQERAERVYEQMLALADPKTGTLQVAASDLAEIIGEEEKRDVQYAIKVLQRDGRIVMVSNHGSSGARYRIPALVKGDTVTRYEKPAPAESKEWVKSIRLPDIPKPPETPETPEPATDAVKLALENLEDVLIDAPDVLNILLSAYGKTRKAARELIRTLREEE